MDQPEKEIDLPKKKLKKKRKKQKNDDEGSLQHRAGIFGIGFGIFASVINLTDQNWIQASLTGYILGIITYYVYRHRALFRHKSGELKSPIDAITEILELNKPTQNTVLIQEPIQEELNSEKLMTQFNDLFDRSYSNLPTTAQIKLQDIHNLLGVMTQKIQRQNDLDSQIEMLKIQRIVNQYITPLLEHYTDLPEFLRDRSQGNELSPNDMLMQQLHLIHNEVLKTTEHVFQNNLAALSVHGDFLKQKLMPHDFFKLDKES